MYPEVFYHKSKLALARNQNVVGARKTRGNSGKYRHEGATRAKKKEGK